MHPYRPFPFRIFILPALSALSIPTGCSDFQRARFNQGEGVGRDSVLAVPFSEPRKSRWYTESERGTFVAEAFKAWVQMQGHPDPVAGDGVDTVIKQVRNWEKDRIAIEDWQKLATGLGAKYVLVGEIEDLTLKNPSSVGILEPTLQASYRLVNLESGRLALERKSFSVRLEKPGEAGLPALEIGADMREVERRLLGKLAEQIGHDLYGYYRDPW